MSGEVIRHHYFSGMKNLIQKILGLFALVVVAIQTSNAQNISQNLKGKITETVTAAPLEGAAVKVTDITGHEFATTTDAEGMFSLSVVVGRYQLVISFTGYRTFKDEILIVAGKEKFVNVVLEETQTVLQAVEIGGSTLNELPGLQSISIEKTLRVAANFFDPVRMITSYPGVVAASDQNNAIIVRGNSPNGLLWRLNGLDIVNPNHLANAGTLSDRPAASGGGVNILSAQMLDRTDFYMGALPARFGNTLAGVVDMKLREGNKGEHEFTAQASVIGLDFSAEGPMGKKDNNAFLVNYRYSTVGLLSAAGVNFGDEAITFQDLSFNTSFNQKNGSNLSLFGLWGQSKNKFEAKETPDIKEDKDRYNIDYDAMTYAVGANYMVPFSIGKFSAGVAYSNNDQDRNAAQEPTSPLPQFQRTLLLDEFANENAILSSNIRVELRAGEKSSFDLGVMANQIESAAKLFKRLGCNICGSVDEERLIGSINGLLLQPFVSYKTSLAPWLDVDAGIRYVNFSFNNTSAIEPRAGLALKPSDISIVNFSYSLTSQHQLPQVYLSEGNEELELTKSHHADANYRQTLSNGIQLSSGVFYQLLFDVPIENSTSSTFSVLNLMEGLTPQNLVSKGNGENYGIDLTVEKYFFSKNYLLLGGTYYESKYTGGDGVKRNTRFNGNYTLNAVYGKEWMKASKNRTIGLNTRVLYLGGLRESSINVNESQSDGETFYDQADPFNNKLGDYFRIDLRLSFRKDKPGYTRTFAIDIQNLTSQKNEGYHYYDQVQQKVITKYQLGIIPVLVYRIDF
jgi:hypothetical protein